MWLEYMISSSHECVVAAAYIYIYIYIFVHFMHHVSLHCCLAEILEVGRFLLRRGQNAEFFILVYFFVVYLDGSGFSGMLQCGGDGLVFIFSTVDSIIPFQK